MSMKDIKKLTEVYMAVNLVNGKRYIGVTCSGINKRKSSHKSNAFRHVAGNNAFYRASFYGVSAMPIKECCHGIRKISKKLKKTFVFYVGNAEAA